jgi:hypothetical protein
MDKVNRRSFIKVMRQGRPLFLAWGFHRAVFLLRRGRANRRRLKIL